MINIKNILFSNTSLWQTVFKNFFWLFVGEFFSRFLRFLLVILAIKILGPQEWGVFAYAVGFGALVTILVDIGVSPVLTREIAKDNSQENVVRVLSNSAFIKFATTLIGFIIVFFLSPYFSSMKEALPLFSLVALIITFDNIREFVFSVVRAFERMELEAFVNIVTNLGILLTGLCVIYYFPSAYNLAFAYMIGSMVGAFYGIYLIKDKLKGLFSKISLSMVKMFFVASMPFALYQSLSAALFNTDLYLIGYFKGAKDVGFYSAFQRIALLIFVLPSIFSSSIFPKFSKFSPSDKDKLLDILQKSLKISLFIGLPLSIFAIVFADKIIPLIFSQEFSQHTLTFQVLMFTFLLAFPMSIFGNLLFSLHREKEFIKLFIISFLINLIFDILLIDKYGILGAAFGVFVAQAFSTSYFYYLSKQIFKKPIFYNVSKIVLSSILLFAFLMFLSFLNINYIISLASGVLFYILVLRYLKEDLLFKLRALRG